MSLLIEYKHKYPQGGDVAVVVEKPVDLMNQVGKRRVLELAGTSVPYEVKNENEVEVFLSDAVLGSAGLGLAGFDEDLGGETVGRVKSLIVGTEGDYVIHLTTGFETAVVGLVDRELKQGDSLE